MSVNAWEPAPAGDTFTIQRELLERFITLSASEQLDDLAHTLPAELQQSQRPLMTLGETPWTEAAKSLDNDQLLHLVRFFTVAEAQLEGWEAGEQSPVIWLAKALRRRKSPPSKELLRWIRAHSDNRFLPYGPL